jgi:Fur family peroxide stress response transcriptional regulator
MNPLCRRKNVNAMTDRRIQRMGDLCRELNLPLTPQKVEIFRYLAATSCHPSAQEIFEAMKKRFPTIAFSTVYKNLTKFKELGLVREIPMKDGSSSRFDANMENHHHIINLDTLEVIDVDSEEIGEICIPQSLDKYQLEKVSIKFYVRNMPEKKE